MSGNDFLNPKSMITPSIAGALVMFLTNTLWVQFGLPQKWTAFDLSYILVSYIVYKYKSKLFEKLILGFLNGLIIFSFAVSSNYGIPKIINMSQSSHIFVAMSSGKRQFFDDWFQPYLFNKYNKF